LLGYESLWPVAPNKEITTMVRRNKLKKAGSQFTYGGSTAFAPMTPLQQLSRSVMSCMLWENEFYEDGQTIADRIAATATLVNPNDLAHLAIVAREDMNLRHVPLLLLDVLSKTGPAVMAATTARVITRADQMGELLAIYWRNGRKTVPRQMRKGLDAVFRRFNEYELAKYDRNGAIKLRDILRLVRPNPDDEAQSALWKRVKDRTLATPDTWEVGLSTGADKKETFERLIRDGKLGYLALLRNLRNMAQAAVDPDLVNNAIRLRHGAHRVLPFRYIAAARAAPQFERALDDALFGALAELPRLGGKTAIVIDVSGSMSASMSRKSDLSRMDAACALAAIGRELFDDVRIFATAGNDSTRIHKSAEVPARRGMALVEAIKAMSRPFGGGGNFLMQVMDYVGRAVKQAERVIVVTDEQDTSGDDSPRRTVPIAPLSYMVNVASARNGSTSTVFRKTSFGSLPNSRAATKPATPPWSYRASTAVTGLPWPGRSVPGFWPRTVMLPSRPFPTRPRSQQRDRGQWGCLYGRVHAIDGMEGGTAAQLLHHPPILTAIETTRRDPVISAAPAFIENAQTVQLIFASTTLQAGAISPCLSSIYSRRAILVRAVRC